MTHKRLLVAVVLLAASGVLAQSQGHITLECNPQFNNCGTLTNVSVPPSPVWVPDPSAGHYDCPDGWTAYTPSEPRVFQTSAFLSAIGYPPKLDRKRHVLNKQPPAPICIQEKP